MSGLFGTKHIFNEKETNCSVFCSALITRVYTGHEKTRFTAEFCKFHAEETAHNSDTEDYTSHSKGRIQIVTVE
jgi:hypothetical protein